MMQGRDMPCFSIIDWKLEQSLRSVFICCYLFLSVVICCYLMLSDFICFIIQGRDMPCFSIIDWKLEQSPENGVQMVIVFRRKITGKMITCFVGD